MNKSLFWFSFGWLCGAIYWWIITTINDDIRKIWGQEKPEIKEKVVLYKERKLS